MIPNGKWTKDWQIRENTSREKKIADDLIKVFIDFWKHQGIDEKSKTTKSRYSGALH